MNKSTSICLDNISAPTNTSCVAIQSGAKLIYASKFDTSGQKNTLLELITLIAGQDNYECVNLDGKELFTLYDVEYTYIDL